MNIEVPDNYGLVILGCVVGPFVANMYMGGPVMKARKELDVQYPNLYAVVRPFLWRVFCFFLVVSFSFADLSTL